MPSYICVTKCYYQNRLWEEGEEMPWGDETSSPPRHFALKDGVEAEKASTLEMKEKEIEELRKVLDEKGLTYDLRWGKSKLEALLSLAKRDNK